MVFQIQELYIDPEFQKQAQEFFNSEGQIQLKDFFTPGSKEFLEFTSTILSKKCARECFKEEYNPLSHKYKILDQKNTLAQSREHEFFKSKTFQEIIEQTIGFDLQLVSSEISLFSHKSYELIHDEKITNSLLIDVYFFITHDEYNEFDGGHKVYTTFDEEIFYLTPEHNALTCVFRDEELRQYTKYINVNAKHKKYIQIKNTYEVVEGITQDLI